MPSLITEKYIQLSIIKGYYITCIEDYINLFFGDPQGQIKGKINKCLYMAYTGCMDIVCRVEGKAGLVLGEKQGWFQRVLDPGTSINCDWGKEKRREYDH